MIHKVHKRYFLCSHANWNAQVDVQEWRNNMCGIVGYVGRRDCADVLINALTKLEYRGYDSAGIAVFENNAIRVEKSKGISI